MKKQITFTSFGIVIVALFIAFSFKSVDANPSAIIETKSAPATTTVTAMTVGTATTTPAVDTQSDGGVGADSAALAVQFTASTTGSILRIEFEYANLTFVNGVFVDCTITPNACDWYSDNLVATSTTSNLVNANKVLSWTFGSTTTGGIPATTQRANKIFGVSTPTRYIRAVLSMTGANGMVWTDWVTRKETR